MVQRSDSTRLLLETAQPLRISGKGSRQYLDGYVATQANVACTVDLSHAASAQRRENFVRAKFRTRGKRHVRRNYRRCKTAQPGRYWRVAVEVRRRISSKIFVTTFNSVSVFVWSTPSTNRKWLPSG